MVDHVSPTQVIHYSAKSIGTPLQIDESSAQLKVHKDMDEFVVEDIQYKIQLCILEISIY